MISGGARTLSGALESILAAGSIGGLPPQAMNLGAAGATGGLLSAMMLAGGRGGGGAAEGVAKDALQSAFSRPMGAGGALPGAMAPTLDQSQSALLAALSTPAGLSTASMLPHAATMAAAAAAGTTSGIPSAQATRPFRRLYVGGLATVGFPVTPGMLEAFFNTAVLRVVQEKPKDEGKFHPVLAVYVSPQGNFAFIEFNTIEITTACLQLDGKLSMEGGLVVVMALFFRSEARTERPRGRP